MTSSRIHAVIVFAFCVLALALGWLLKPTIKVSDLLPKLNLEVAIPTVIGSWRLDDRMPVQLVSPDQASLLSKIYNQTLSRTYIDPDGYRVMLSIAYGGDQSDGTSAHRPEVCYPAQGFQILGNRRTTLSIGGQDVQARLLKSRLGERYEPVTYWIVVGHETVTGSLEQKLAQLGYGIKGYVPDGLLLRVSSIDRDDAKAYAKQLAFLEDLNRALSASPHHARLFGGPAPVLSRQHAAATEMGLLR